MRRRLINFLTLLFLIIPLILTGCGGPYAHDKPEMYKHNVVIADANKTVRNFDKGVKNLPNQDSKEVAAIWLIEYQYALGEHLKSIEDSRVVLNGEKNLDSREKKELNRKFDEAKKKIEERLKRIDEELPIYKKK